MMESQYREAAAAFKEILAEQMGCDAADYDSNALTIVERPEDSWEPHLALATTCGTGSVLSVRDPRLADWADEQPLETHFRIFLPSFLEGLAAEARRLGHTEAKSHSATTGMIHAGPVPSRKLKPPYELRRLGVDEQLELREEGHFENALGEPTELRRIKRMKRAFGIDLPDGQVIAVAGIWDQYPGVQEIGVDVLPAHRGEGLAQILTVYSAKWIRAAGNMPIYTYGFSNTRSANNGLKSGFRPLWNLSAVFVPEDMT